MDVRPIEPADIPRCAELFAAAFAREPWREEWDIADATARLDEVYRTPGAYGLVAEENGRLLGFALGHIEHLNREQHFYLKEMTVAPERQREGIGAALMETLCCTLKEMGVTIVYLLTLRASPAEAFYRKCGFYPSGQMIVMGRRLHVV